MSSPHSFLCSCLMICPPPLPPQWQQCCSTQRSLGQVQVMCWGPCVSCCCWVRCTARSCQQNPAGGPLAVHLPARAPALHAGRGAFLIGQQFPPMFYPFRTVPCAGVTITTLVFEDSRHCLSFTLPVSGRGKAEGWKKLKKIAAETGTQSRRAPGNYTVIKWGFSP